MMTGHWEKLRVALDRFVALLLPDEVLGSVPPAVKRRMKTIAVFMVALTVCVPVFLALYWVLLPPDDARVVMASIVVHFLWGCTSCFYFVRRGSVEAGGHCSVASLTVLLVTVTWYTSGLDSPALFWLVLVPILAFTLIGRRAAFVYAAGCASIFSGVGLATSMGLVPEHGLSEASMAYLRFICLVGLTILVILLVLVYELANDEVLEELAGARAAAEQASAAKSEFLANMSHEIRTPMTALLGYADVLHDEGNLQQAPPERLEAVTTIKRNVEYLLGILNDILDVSKIEAHKMEIESLECSPLDLVDEVRGLVSVRAEAKGLDLAVEFGGPLPEKIHTDPTRLRQILINLVGNAIKFTEVGSVRLHVEHRVARDSRIAFCVVDTGIGMSEEQMERLFRPFSQADSSTTREYGGTGLGLAISSRLAELLGGEIRVESRPGEGSTFELVLPTGAGVDCALIDPRAAPGQPPAVPAPEPSPAEIRLPYRILLAEDGPDNQRLIGHFLRAAGAEVTIAPNGAAAVERALAADAEGRAFDVILMDMQMPVMDGYAATGELRARRYPGPIIALTAHAMSTDRARCIGAGCDEFETKPVNREALFRKIARLAARRV